METDISGYTIDSVLSQSVFGIRSDGVVTKTDLSQ